MYFGHFAVATAVKAKEPEIPIAPLIIGTGVLDIVNGVMIMLGADKVTPNLNSLPYLFFDLTFIDWDHSLVMAVLWSLLWGLTCWRFYNKNKKVGIISTLVTFSHFLVDLPMHNSDMALYPHSETKLGFGLWGSLGLWSWVVEVIFMLVLLTYAWKKHKDRGENIWMQVTFVCLLAIQMSPWFSPMKIVATFAEPFAHLVHGFLVFIGFTIPSFILMWMYKKSSEKVVKTQ